MFLNQRRSQIITEILTQDATPTLETLVNRFRLSPRTIRYDIQAINQHLQEFDLPPLQQNRLGQYSFPASKTGQAQVACLIETLKQISAQNYLSKEQRVHVILASLILAPDYVTINQLAQKIGVSRNTIVGDLEGAKIRLAGYNLALSSQPKYGLSIKGKERRCRRGYIRLLREALSISNYLMLPALTAKPALKENTYPDLLYYDIAEVLNFATIAQHATALQEQINMHFSDVSNADLILGIALAVYRAGLGQHCGPEDYQLDKFTATVQHQAVLKLSEEIERSFLVDFTPEDICFITQYLLVADVLYAGQNSAKEKPTDRHLILSNLIAGVSADTGIDFSKNKELFFNLDLEAVPALYRISNEIRVINPLLEEIKRDYSPLFQAVRGNILPLKLYTGLSISDHEVGLLTLHFIVADENMAQSFRRPRVLVMCGLGFGSANLLVSKLRQNFLLDIVEVISLRNLETALARHSIDFIITSVMLDHAEIPFVYVSPFLPPTDVDKINNLILHLREERPLITVSADTRPIDDPPIFGLLDVLTVDTIDLHYNATSFSDSIYHTGQLLINSGAVTQPYVVSMVQAAEEIGPYIVFSKGVALPHSNAKQFVHKIGISMVRLQKPVVSGHPDNDPVSLLFAFASPDEKSHVNVIMQLGKVISSGGVEQLLQIDTPQQALEIIRQILEN